MNDREWSAFAAECEASFRGDLDDDRELALREHIGAAELPDARAAIARLVSQGHVMAPAPAELYAAVKAVERERRVSERQSEQGREFGAVYCSHARLGDPSCSGQMRVQYDDGRCPIALECDACGYEVAVARPGNATAPHGEPAGL